jgi:hypothetical protein
MREVRRSVCCFVVSHLRELKPDLKAVFRQIGSYPASVRLDQFFYDRKADSSSSQLP